MLKGKYLSIVQEYGLEILMILDNHEDAARYARDFKARIAAAHPAAIEDIFAEEIAEAKRLEAADAVEHALDTGDYGDVRWSKPGEVSEDDYNRIMAELSAGVSMSGEEVPVGNGEWV